MPRTWEDIQNELLVLHAQEGDVEAFKTLVKRWQPRFARLAWRLTHDREAARDAVQETWLAVIRGLAKLDDPARFTPWALRIVKYKCADWARGRVRARKARKESQAGWNPVAVATTEQGRDELQRSDDLRQLKRMLATMPPHDQAILSLHYLDEMGVEQIAQVLDLPAGTVKSRLFHARRRLKDALERQA